MALDAKQAGEVGEAEEFIWRHPELGNEADGRVGAAWKTTGVPAPRTRSVVGQFHQSLHGSGHNGRVNIEQRLMELAVPNAVSDIPNSWATCFIGRPDDLYNATASRLNSSV